ncbi:MAG: hypothetical protein ACTSO4_13085 [Promethearchaeota archaeon]
MRVAFNKINITPKNYKGMPLAGYTRKSTCTGKFDDVYAHGVLIDGNDKLEGKNTLLLISLDLLKIPISISKYIRNKIIERHPELDFNNIIIHAIHTHAAFDLTGEFHWSGGLFSVMRGIMFGANRNDEYIVWMSNQIVKMVDNLFVSLEPCEFSWTIEEFNPDIVINRRHPSWRSKPNLGIIAFKKPDSREIMGVIINYACHPTTLSFKNFKVSADYPGQLLKEIETRTNNKIKAIFFNGPSGDLNPITTCGIDYEALEEDKNKIYDQLGTYEDTQRIGKIIANEVLELASKILDNKFYDEINLDTYVREFWVPFKDYRYFSRTWFNNKLFFWIKKYLLMNVGKYNISSANFPIFNLDKNLRKSRTKTLIQFIKITANKNGERKDLGIACVPGELFEDIGKAILEHSVVGKENTFIFQNSQDWIAYLFPMNEYIEVGGYEPLPSFSPLAGLIIENKMISLFKEIKS